MLFLVGILLHALTLAGADEPARIEQVAWLQGCWQLDANGRVVEEQWMAPRGGVMLSMGRTVRDGKLIEYESIVLGEKGNGLAYEAHPSGQPSAVFISTTVTASTVVFENLAHDFPQRVGYQADGEKLLAWIDGSVNGKQRRVEFPYHRVACAGPR